jgi:hypothetical protein
MHQLSSDLDASRSARILGAPVVTTNVLTPFLFLAFQPPNPIAQKNKPDGKPYGATLALRDQYAGIGGS